MKLKRKNLKKNLIIEFWSGVKGFLQELTKGNGWEIYLDEKIFERYSKIYVTLNDSFSVVFEGLISQPFYGLVIDFNNKNLDRERINEHAKSIEAIKGMKKSEWYLGYTLTNENFDNIETLKRILPENRDVLAQDFATLLFDFANEVKEDASKMVKMTKD